MVELNDYIDNLQNAIVSNPFLTNRNTEDWLATFHDIGYGLKDYPEKDVKNILGTLYGKLFVLPHMKHNRKLPNIDAKDMIKEIKKGMTKYNG